MVFRSVIQEWEQWATTARSARTLSAWQRQYTELSRWNWRELRFPECSPATDTMQACLVALAQAGDERATATLIVQMQPGLEALARRALGYNGRWSSLTESSEEVEGVFGEVLLTHSLERRPRRIAANLLLDTRQRLWRSGLRHLPSGTSPAGDLFGAQRCAASASTYPLPEEQVDALNLLSDLAQALGQLHASEDSRQLTAEVAYRAWVLDEPPSHIASSIGLQRNAVNTRLCRLRSEVRRVREYHSTPETPSDLGADQRQRWNRTPVKAGGSVMLEPPQTRSSDHGRVVGAK